MHFVTTATPMQYNTKSKLCHSYLWPQGWIHNIHIQTYIHIHMKVIQKTNLKWLYKYIHMHNHSLKHQGTYNDHEVRIPL